MRVSFPQNLAKLGVRVSFIETLHFCAGGRRFPLRNPHKINQNPENFRACGGLGVRISFPGFRNLKSLGGGFHFPEFLRNLRGADFDGGASNIYRPVV